MRRRVLLLLALAGLALASSSSDVAKLTAGDFDERVGDGKVYLVKFFAPWCGHCKRLAPTWDELAAAYKGHDKVVVASVDCTEHKDVCTKAEIRGYPTLKLYHGGNAVDSYKGARELEAFKTYLTDKVKSLTEETTA